MYYLKLDRAINVFTSPGASCLTDAIGPFHTGDEAHEWFVRNSAWLDNRNVGHVENRFMAMPMEPQKSGPFYSPPRAIHE